ncbi:MAG: segregation/condensation protein A [bacterium]|nr:segregation/condensation protein A [bacterium]
MTYTVKVKEFEGALDVLLNLIESKKLSINEVSLGSVTEEYFAYLEAAKDTKTDTYHTEIASFLVIAATLMLVKSRSLLPGFHITKEEEEDIQELEERLRAYKFVKEFAKQLGEHSRVRKPLHTRGAFVAVQPEFLAPTKGFDLNQMLELLKHLTDTLPQNEDLPEKEIKKIVSIEERIREIEKRISAGAIKTFSDLITDKKERIDVVVSFLAMLELVKLGVIAAKQSNTFDTINIEHGKSGD